MTVSQKQLAANKRNAKKGGVKTAEGKSISKMNAVKHGLLANEAIVLKGDGVESKEVFDTLLFDLRNEFQPQGVIENMLVEKLAIVIWKQRRMYRCETGLIHKSLDNCIDGYYSEKDFHGNLVIRNSQKLKNEIESIKNSVHGWEMEKKRLQKCKDKNETLETLDQSEDLCSFYYEHHIDMFTENDIEEAPVEPTLTEVLSDTFSWKPDRIWKTLIDFCDRLANNNRKYAAELEAELEKALEKEQLEVEARLKQGVIPPESEMDRMMRYGSYLDRQFFKILEQLNIIQEKRICT